MAIATNATAMINSKAIVNVSLRMVLLLLGQNSSVSGEPAVTHSNGR
jgi:hypothetical protein